MKKKIFGLALACLMVPGAIAFTGCDVPPPTNLTKAEYSQAYESVTTSYNNYLDGVQNTPLSLMSAVNDSDFVAVSNTSQSARMTSATVKFVGFLKNLCDNDTFEISTDFQEMAIVDTSVSGYVGNYNLRIKMSYNSTTSVISSEVYCEDDDYKTYLVFDILFDFETDTLDYFTITGAMGSGTMTANNVNYFKFEDNLLKILPQTSESFQGYAEGVLEDFETISSGEWGTNLPDYSEEYVSAMLDGEAQPLSNTGVFSNL